MSVNGILSSLGLCDVCSAVCCSICCTRSRPEFVVHDLALVVSFTLNEILHGKENDSKYRDVAPLSTDVYETRKANATAFGLL